MLELATDYTQPLLRQDITVLGGRVKRLMPPPMNYAWATMPEHDIKIAHKVSWVLCGGDLTGAQQVLNSTCWISNGRRSSALSEAKDGTHPKLKERINWRKAEVEPMETTAYFEF